MKSDKEVHQEMTFFVLFHFTGMFFEPSSRMKKQHKKVCDRESAGGGKREKHPFHDARKGGNLLSGAGCTRKLCTDFRFPLFFCPEAGKVTSR